MPNSVEWWSFRNFNRHALIRVLVANTGLPSQKIGSWTNRITRLTVRNPDFFNYILSPTSFPDSVHLYCEKRKWIPFFPKRWRSWEILNHQAGQFIRAFRRLPLKTNAVQVLVMDDLVLLEAFTLLKSKELDFELIFSFHGHSFVFPGAWAGKVDKVLFLSKTGYLDTLRRHEEFTPLVSIVGNGVDSSIFYPLSQEDKIQRKVDLGLPAESRVLIWLSNNRRKKGFHLFEKLAHSLIGKYENLTILIIGIKPDQSFVDPKVKFIGKIPNRELPRYLQAGDFYAFTSLWKEGFGLSLAEAAKCGNRVIVSNMGGIPEVVDKLPGAILVELPNVLSEWENAFDLAWNDHDKFHADAKFLDQFQDLNNWESNYLNSLQN